MNATSQPAQTRRTRSTAWRRPGKWPLEVLVAAVLVVGPIATAAVLMWLNWRLRSVPFWSWPTPQARVGPELLELVKVALTVVAGVGGFVALTVAYSRQRWLEDDVAGEREKQKALHDRYGAGVAQLGHEHPTVRLAGVYALTNLADQWEPQRQQCVDVLCAYLRIPWQPRPDGLRPLARKPIETANDPQAGDKTAYTYPSSTGDGEVRKTIIRVIAEHLRPSADEATNSGPAVFERVILSGFAVFEAAIFSWFAWFSRATFSEESRFTDVSFTGSTRFDGANFERQVDFSRAEFEKQADFAMARFLGDTVFETVKFRQSATFRTADFSGGVTFARAKFLEEVWFDGATPLLRADFFETKFSRPPSKEIREFLTAKQLAGARGEGADEAEGGEPAG